MSDSKKILILTADVGFGHRSAANAIAAALMESHFDGCQVDVVNPLDDERTPAMLRDSQTDYDRMVRQMPDLYKLRYQISDAPVPNSIVESAFTVMLYTILNDLVRRYQPDVIVTTHPMFPAPLSAVIATNRVNTPFLIVVTDLVSVHRMWFNENAELIFVPTREALESALQTNIPEDKIQITGIPVNPKLVNDKRSKVELRADLGWRTDMTTALVVGSKRVNNLQEFLEVLNHSGFPLQWVIVAGGDDELYQWLKKQDWHRVTHLYNFVEDMPTMLRAADFIVSKAGGLIVTEALACGLPLMLVDVTPGQEEGNAAYLLEHNAGEQPRTPLESLKTICHWLENDQKLLEQGSKAARELGRPRAAFAIADFIWSAAERGPLPVPASRTAFLPRLMEMLGQFGIGSESASASESQAV